MPFFWFTSPLQELTVPFFWFFFSAERDPPALTNNKKCPLSSGTIYLFIKSIEVVPKSFLQNIFPHMWIFLYSMKVNNGALETFAQLISKRLLGLNPLCCLVRPTSTLSHFHTSTLAYFHTFTLAYFHFYTFHLCCFACSISSSQLSDQNFPFILSTRLT